MPVSTNKLLPLFLTDSFRGTAVSLLNFFSSIFIYKIFLNTFGSHKDAIIGVLVYNLVVYLVFIFAEIFADFVSYSWGLKKTLFLGQVFLAVTIGYLILAESSPIFTIFSAVTYGLSAGFFWFSWNCFLAKEGRIRHFGQELGLNHLAISFFTLFAPVLGGLVIYFFGYLGLFLAGLATVGASLITISFIKNDHIRHKTALSELIAIFKLHPKAFWSYFGFSASSTISSTLLPLYIFLILGRELSLGKFFTASLIFTAIATYFVGRWIDRHGGKKPLEAGVFAQVAVWLFRTITQFPPLLLIIDVFDRISSNMVSLPLSIEAFEKAVLDHNTGRAILFRETALHLGSVVALLLVILLFFLTNSLKTAFFIAATFSLLPLLDTSKKKTN